MQIRLSPKEPLRAITLNATDIAVWIVRLVFGGVGVGACLMLVLGIFIFDAPGSTNLWSVNLAVAPFIYLALYALSLSPPPRIKDQAPPARARLFRACLPLLGLAWYGLAWLAIEKVCHGNFSY